MSDPIHNEDESNEAFLAQHTIRALNRPESDKDWQALGHDWLISRSEALSAVSLIGATLYAIQYGDGTVKIGWTQQLKKRLERLHADGDRAGHGKEFRLLAFCFGTRADEAELHRSLVEHRVHGSEWYRPTSDVMASFSGWFTPNTMAA